MQTLVTAAAAKDDGVDDVSLSGFVSGSLSGVEHTKALTAVHTNHAELATVLRRYSPPIFFIHRERESPIDLGQDLLLLQAPNGLCVVCLAPTHRLFSLSPAAKLERIEYAAPFDDFLAASSAAGSGKTHAKRERQRRCYKYQPLLTVHFKSCAAVAITVPCAVQGSLLDINRGLVDDPGLLLRCPYSAGHLAIIRPATVPLLRIAGARPVPQTEPASGCEIKIDFDDDDEYDNMGERKGKSNEVVVLAAFPVEECSNLDQHQQQGTTHPEELQKLQTAQLPHSYATYDDYVALRGDSLPESERIVFVYALQTLSVAPDDGAEDSSPQNPFRAKNVPYGHGGGRGRGHGPSRGGSAGKYGGRDRGGGNRGHGNGARRRDRGANSQGGGQRYPSHSQSRGGD